MNLCELNPGKGTNRHRTATNRLSRAFFHRREALRTNINAAIANSAVRDEANKTGVANRANNIAQPTVTNAPATAPAKTTTRRASIIVLTSQR